MLQNKIERHYEAQELEEYFAASQLIYQLIVDFARNSVLSETHQWLMGRVDRARYLALNSPDRSAESIAEHRNFLAALEAGDAELAGTLLGAHVRRSGEVVVRTLKCDTRDDDQSFQREENDEDNDY